MRGMAVCAAIVGSLMLAGVAVADSKAGSEMAHQQPTSLEFTRIKALAGKWKGTSTGPEGKDLPAMVEYRVTSGGSAVVETLFPGTEHEMVSVYHERNGRLSITHYCMLGNQPELALTGASPNQMDLSLAPGSGINAATETHMHALTLNWADPDHLTQTWTLFEHGKATSATVITVARERQG